MMSLDKLPANTKSLFLSLTENNKDGLLDDFLLIGGTALTMRMEHRVSEDLDFAIGALRLPVKKISELIKRLEKSGLEVIDTTNEAARDDFENDGLEIENYHQDWLVNGTKLTFFTYGKSEYEQKMLNESSPDLFQGIKVASLDAIAKTKCHAVTRRTKSRDLFDIYHLINAGYLSIDTVIAEMQKANPHMTYETCVHRLAEKPIQKDDEGLQPIGVDISVEKIRDFLLERIDELELNISKEFLQQYNPIKPDENKQYTGSIKIQIENEFIQALGRNVYIAHQQSRVGNLEIGTTYTIQYKGQNKPVVVTPAPPKEKNTVAR